MIAPDLARYLSLASAGARDAARRAALRERLRDVRRSPLFDMDCYAARFAEAVSGAWAARRTA
jgi:predicted O-linked N-acetylglucosamine transferase (SPINDLY family)